MDRIGRGIRKTVSLYVAFALMMPLVGIVASNGDVASVDDGISFDVTIESIGSLSQPGARTPMEVTLEAVRDSSLGDAERATFTNELVHSSPNDIPGPSPLDAPFGSDILVYNSTYNQTNPSIDHDSGGNVFVAFEHSWGFDSDIYVSKSSDDGQSWFTIPVANTASNESCPSMAITYSPSAGSEKWYVFYEADELEYAWSDDGTTWSRTVIGWSSWSTVSCPYVVADGDFVVVVAKKYDDQTSFQDTWYILYSLDGFQTIVSYYWVFWDGAWASGPRATIIDDDEVFVAFDMHDRSDPDPDKWSHDTLVAQGTLTGDVGSDNWPYWVYGSGFRHHVPTSPTVASIGRNAIFTQEVLDPSMNGMDTSTLWCVWTSDLQGTSTNWNGCNNDTFYLAFDATDTIDQKLPMLHSEGSSFHAVWLNGTDVNYRYSSDGGKTWAGEPNTGLPLKVNDAGVGTVLKKYHSPDITVFDGKPGVVWHDARWNGSIYFSTLGNVVFFTIYTDPLVGDAMVREVGDIWRFPPITYLWTRGSNHDIETIGIITVPGGSTLNFCYWSDGSLLNPTTVTVNASDPQITAIYCCSNSTMVVGTSPTGLLVEIDDVQYAAPGVICCDNSSVHKVHAPSPQPTGPNSWYEFSHWSDSGTQTHYLDVNGIAKIIAYYSHISNQNPFADADGPYLGRKNFQVNFTGSGSFDPDGMIVSYEWDFGDGSPHGFGENVNHTYASGGTFDVILNVTDDQGFWTLDNTTADIQDMSPDPPFIGGAVLAGLTSEDVHVTWSLSADDGEAENDVVNYTILYSTDFGASFSILDVVSPGTDAYVHTGGGHGDPNSYVYTVCAYDDVGQSECSPQSASKFTKNLSTGMQLVSIPVVLSDTSTPNVFQTVSYVKITHYDAMAGKRHNWKTYDTRKPYSDLKNVNHTMALWIEVTSDSWFTVAGLVPWQTTIHLVTGWNFVGYPSFISEDVNTNLAGANWQNVETFDPTNIPWHLKRLSGTDPMSPGEGYWIHVSSDFVWVLSN